MEGEEDIDAGDISEFVKLQLENEKSNTGKDGSEENKYENEIEAINEAKKNLRKKPSLKNECNKLTSVL